MNERIIKRMLDPVMRRVRLLCSRGRVNLINDGHKAQNMQVSLLSGETMDNVERLQNYGFSSVPTGGNDAICLSVGGKREHLVAIAVDDRAVRPQGKESGDVIVYHAEGHYIRLTADGRAIIACKNIEFHVDETAQLNAQAFEVNAQQTTFNGDSMTVNCTTTTLNTNLTVNNTQGGSGGSATLNGDMQINGGATVVGHTELTGGANIDGVEFGIHWHDETGSKTGGPQ